MNIFTREKRSTTPVVPPAPSKEELEHPITRSQTPKDAGMHSGFGVDADPTTKVREKPAWGLLFFFIHVSTAVSKAPCLGSERGSDSTQVRGPELRKLGNQSKDKGRVFMHAGPGRQWKSPGCGQMSAVALKTLFLS